MAVHGALGHYIVRHYKRLLVCVVPPTQSDDVDRPSSSSPPSPNVNSTSPSQPCDANVSNNGKHSTQQPRRRRSTADSPSAPLMTDLRVVPSDVDLDTDARDSCDNGTQSNRRSRRLMHRPVSLPGSMRGWRPRSRRGTSPPIVFVPENSGELVSGKLTSCFQRLLF